MKFIYIFWKKRATKNKKQTKNNNEIAYEYAPFYTSIARAEQLFMHAHQNLCQY